MTTITTSEPQTFDEDLYDNDLGVTTKGNYTIGSGLNSDFTHAREEAEPRSVNTLEPTESVSSMDRAHHEPEHMKTTMRGDAEYENQKHYTEDVLKGQDAEGTHLENDHDGNTRRKESNSGLLGKVGNMLGVGA